MARTPTADADVFDNADEHRYEIESGSRLAGFAAYEPGPEGMVFTHTEIGDAFEGQGLGGRLARAALDDARRQGRTVIPRCSFIAEYIRRHPEYVDVVDERHRDDVRPRA